MLDLEPIVKAYDIRGTYPDQIDADTCRALGVAFAAFLAEEDAGTARVVLARDMRPSGEALSAAFADGVRSQGLDVVDIGLASTDLLYFASGRLDAPGAMFTASHNPAQYNGIKLCRSGARPIGQESGLGRIKELARLEVQPAASRGEMSEQTLLAEFADHVLSFIDPGAMRPLKVVADTANGMGGLVVPVVFERLPDVEVEVMYPELDGTFPNHPADPIQLENLADLRARVREVGADVGLAFDGDADRVFLVDERGEPVSGSLTTALLARAVLEREPGAKIVHNLICSKVVPEIVTEHGGEPIRTRVGHSYIKAVMKETGALFAGEHSGHYYFRDNFRADSGLIAAMVLLEAVSDAGAPLSQVVAPYQRYAQSGELNTAVVDQAAALKRVAAAFAGEGEAERVDGLTVDGDGWWFNLRPSNTEPLLRLNVEAADTASMQRIRDRVLALVGTEQEETWPSTPP